MKSCIWHFSYCLSVVLQQTGVGVAQKKNRGVGVSILLLLFFFYWLHKLAFLHFKSVKVLKKLAFTISSERKISLLASSALSLTSVHAMPKQFFSVNVQNCHNSVTSFKHTLCMSFTRKGFTGLLVKQEAIIVNLIYNQEILKWILNFTFFC